jgi:hypothetical protein
MRLSLLLILFSAFISSNAQKSQDPKKYTWKELLEVMSASDTSDLIIGEKDEITITGQKFRFDKTDHNKLRDGKLMINRNVSISYPRFRIETYSPDLSARYYGVNEPYLRFDSLFFNKNFKIELEEKLTIISNCIFNKGTSLTFIKGKQNSVAIHFNEFRGQLSLRVSDYTYVHLGWNKFANPRREVFQHGPGWTGSNFTNSDYLYPVLDTLKIYEGSVLSEASNTLAITLNDCRTLLMRENKFDFEGINCIKLGLENSKDITIIKNEFGPNLLLFGSVDTRFTLSNNKFKNLLALFDLQLPVHSAVDWKDIVGKVSVWADTIMVLKNIPSKYYVNTGGGGPKFYNSMYSDSLWATYWYKSGSKLALRNERTFNRMTETYKNLFDLYKSKGELKSSNGAFVAAKNLEGDRLEVMFKDKGGFKNYFSWRLNRLMKVYTNHATEPALALVVSVYILLGFAVFYFFFPSEWDIESKPKLIQHYKDFIHKNDKGYIKPFFKMMFGFFISFINALTLSLNSFVTLGFGNIPTKGLARYVCIVQGFIGWFLLSIFTVALFNQVLF